MMNPIIPVSPHPSFFQSICDLKENLLLKVAYAVFAAGVVATGVLYYRTSKFTKLTGVLTALCGILIIALRQFSSHSKVPFVEKNQVEKKEEKEKEILVENIQSQPDQNSIPQNSVDLKPAEKPLEQSSEMSDIQKKGLVDYLETHGPYAIRSFSADLEKYFLEKLQEPGLDFIEFACLNFKSLQVARNLQRDALEKVRTAYFDKMIDYLSKTDKPLESLRYYFQGTLELLVTEAKSINVFERLFEKLLTNPNTSVEEIEKFVKEGATWTSLKDVYADVWNAVKNA